MATAPINLGLTGQSWAAAIEAAQTLGLSHVGELSPDQARVAVMMHTVAGMHGRVGHPYFPGQSGTIPVPRQATLGSGSAGGRILSNAAIHKLMSSGAADGIHRPALPAEFKLVLASSVSYKELVTFGRAEIRTEFDRLSDGRTILDEHLARVDELLLEKEGLKKTDAHGVGYDERMRQAHEMLVTFQAYSSPVDFSRLLGMLKDPTKIDAARDILKDIEFMGMDASEFGEKVGELTRAALLRLEEIGLVGRAAPDFQFGLKKVAGLVQEAHKSLGLAAKDLGDEKALTRYGIQRPIMHLEKAKGRLIQTGEWMAEVVDKLRNADQSDDVARAQAQYDRVIGSKINFIDDLIARLNAGGTGVALEVKGQMDAAPLFAAEIFTLEVFQATNEVMLLLEEHGLTGQNDPYFQRYIDEASAEGRAALVSLQNALRILEGTDSHASDLRAKMYDAAEQVKSAQQGLQGALSLMKFGATSLRQTASKLFDPEENRRIEAAIVRVLQTLEQDYLEGTVAADRLVSWTVQRAVHLSEDDLAEFYQHMALAAVSYRESVAGYEAFRSQLAERTLETHFTWAESREAARPILFAIDSDHRRRVLLRDGMTLPVEQRGRGVFYNVDEDLAELGLNSLRDSVPDRVPLVARVGSGEIERFREQGVPLDAPEDMLLVEANMMVRFYDLSLRTEFIFHQDGEVLPTDEAVLVMTHGSGTAKSTASSVVRAALSIMNNYVPEGMDNGAVSRHASVIGVGFPWHGFGPRDRRRFNRVVSRGKEVGLPIDAEAGDVEPVLEFMDALHDRYTGYTHAKGHQIPIGFGGRSSGANFAIVHRQTRFSGKNVDGQPYEAGDLTGSGFDFYFAMSGYRYSQYWLDLDTYITMKFSPVAKNLLGYNWVLLMDYGAFGLAHTPDESYAPIVYMGGAYDIGYPCAGFPENLTLSPEPSAQVMDWVRRFVAKIRFNFPLSSHPQFTDEVLFQHGLAIVKAWRDRAMQGIPAGMDVDSYWAWLLSSKNPDREYDLEGHWRTMAEIDSQGHLQFEQNGSHDLLGIVPHHEEITKPVVSRALTTLFGIFDRVRARFASHRR